MYTFYGDMIAHLLCLFSFFAALLCHGGPPVRALDLYSALGSASQQIFFTNQCICPFRAGRKCKDPAV